MILGLCGAQRVGKTTLAKAFAEDYGYTFVQTTTRGILADNGYNAQEQYDLETRLKVQTLILDGLARQWEAMPSQGICDRTPLDVLAYMEADVLRNFPADPWLETKYFEFVGRCKHLCGMFDRMVLVQPGIELRYDPDAAQCSLPYMEHFNTLMLGYSTQHLNVSILPRTCLAIQERLEAVHDAAYQHDHSPTPIK